MVNLFQKRHVQANDGAGVASSSFSITGFQIRLLGPHVSLSRLTEQHRRLLSHSAYYASTWAALHGRNFDWQTLNSTCRWWPSSVRLKMSWRD